MLSVNNQETFQSNVSSNFNKIFAFSTQTDTVWTLFQSPIVIADRIDVTQTVTLTVEPGVNVIFTDPAASIQVFGKNRAIWFLRTHCNFFTAHLLIIIIRCACVRVNIIVQVRHCCIRQSASGRNWWFESCFRIKFSHRGSEVEMDRSTATSRRYV